MAQALIFGDLTADEVAQRAVSVGYAAKGGKSRGEAVVPARRVVPRLPPAAARRAAKAQHRRQNRRRSHRPLQPLTVRSTGYLMLATSLPTEVPAGDALEAYRLRRHVELAFKRLKSLLGPGRLPAKNEALARRWLLGRPITALLIEGTSRPLLRFPRSRRRWADAAPCFGASPRRCGTPCSPPSAACWVSKRSSGQPASWPAAAPNDAADVA